MWSSSPAMQASGTEIRPHTSAQGKGSFELARLARPFAVERTMLQSFEDVVCGSWVLGVVLRCVVPGEGQDTSEIQ